MNYLPCVYLYSHVFITHCFKWINPSINPCSPQVLTRQFMSSFLPSVTDESFEIIHIYPCSLICTCICVYIMYSVHVYKEAQRLIYCCRICSKATAITAWLIKVKQSYCEIRAVVACVCKHLVGVYPIRICSNMLIDHVG